MRNLVSLVCAWFVFVFPPVIVSAQYPDSLPPIVHWQLPHNADTLVFECGHWWCGYDSIFRVSFEDPNPTFGIDTDVVIRIRLCGTTEWRHICGFRKHLSWNYGHAFGSLNLLFLEPGHCYELCAVVHDLAEHETQSCITFYTSGVVPPTDTTDHCPPIAHHWFPDGCLPVIGPWRLFVLDQGGSDDCPVPSCVDLEHYDVVMYVPSHHDTLDITGQCVVSVWEGCGMRMEWNPLGYVLPYDTDVHICANVRDNAGNEARLCHLYHTCPADTTLPLDTTDHCPPLVLEWHPTHCSLLCPPDAPVWFRVVDPSETDMCPRCSGVDVSTIGVFIYNAGTLYNLSHGAGLRFESIGECGFDIVLDHSYYSLVPGTGCTLVVQGADDAGNIFWGGISFFVCDSAEPDDSWSPCVVDVHPASAAIVGPDVNVWANVCDLCGGSVFVSGVNPESIVMTVDGSPVDFILHELDCFGYSVRRCPGAPAFSVGVHTVCVSGADFAGNEFNYCWSFTVNAPCDTFHTIVGFVSDTLDDFPLENIIVVAFRQVGMPFVVHARTNAEGFYSMRVPNGMWILAAFDSSFIYPPVFWDGHRFPFDADPIHLCPSCPDTFWANFGMGTYFAGLYRVCGTVYDDELSPISGALVVAISSDNEEDYETYTISSLTDEFGNFTISLPGGRRYYIMAYGDGYSQRFYGGGWQWATAEDIAVSGDVYDVDFTLSPCGSFVGSNTVYGTVHRETAMMLDDVGFRGVLVCLCDVSTNEPLFCSHSDTGGYYSIPNVPDGVYRLIADRPHYVGRAEWEVINSADGTPHNIYLRLATSGVDARKVPGEMAIRSVYPNPFNSSTSIAFNVPSTAHTRVEVVDVLGNSVSVLIDEVISAGEYIAVWKADKLPSGIYFVRLISGSSINVSRVFLVR